MVLKTKGFTLVELTVVMGIIIMMISIMVGTLNPILLYGRALDGQRKKHLGEIYKTLEEYYNDHRCYPDYDMVNTVLMNNNNCGARISILSRNVIWPCDPIRKTPYIISVPDVACPTKFKVFATLDNLSDNPITETWRSNKAVYLYGFNYPRSQVVGNRFNFGISSYGESWSTKVGDNPLCVLASLCYAKSGVLCGSAPGNACTGGNCFASSSCNSQCQVDTCP